MGKGAKERTFKIKLVQKYEDGSDKENFILNTKT